MADYIERKAAFNMMFSRANPYGGQEKVNPADIWNQAATIIRTMPDSNVRKDVQGEWERFDDIARYRCSVCKNISAKDVTGWNPFLSKFCPNCGARMTGGGEQ